MIYTAYVGSYTGESRNDGIHIFACNNETGDFHTMRVIDTFQNPTYMALTRDCSRLYVALNGPSFGPAGANGGLAAFKVGGDGEKLSLINTIPTGRTGACHVSLAPDERTLVYAEYSCGTAGYADLSWRGALEERCAGAPGKLNPLAQVQHAGDGPNKPRQDRAHAHCAIVTPDGKYQLVVDLSLDKIVAYDFVHRAEGLKEVPAASIDTRRIAPGAGPRHIVFHPNGRFAFVIFELLNKVASFRYTGEGFSFIEIKELLSPDRTNFSKAAAIKISEDGRQLFCSNRGQDSITVFNLDPETGKMAFLNNAPLDGKFPRDFEFMPGGRFCLVGLKESWRVVSYAYDAAKGAFAPVATMEGIYRPLFFKFNLRSART